MVAGKKNVDEKNFSLEMGFLRCRHDDFIVRHYDDD